MTVAEARHAMPTATIRRHADGEGVAWISVDQGDDWLLTLYAGEEDWEAPIDDTAEIEFIEVWHTDFKTAEGVHPGMALREAEKKYGGLKEIIMNEIEAREYAEFVNQPAGLLFRLNHPSGTSGDYQSGEVSTVSYRPGTTIFTVSVIGADVIEAGSIGGIKIGSTEAEVRAVAQGQLTKGEDVIWEVLDNAVQQWIFPESGLSLDMVSERVGGAKTVLSITIEAPSKLQTGRGIGIGAAMTDVTAAYAEFYTNRDEREVFSNSDDVYLVGSIYGGMLFRIKDGKVATIFLGAMAE